jgi:hypothetical protein
MYEIFYGGPYKSWIDTPAGKISLEANRARGAYSDIYFERGGLRRVFAATRYGATDKRLMVLAHEMAPNNPHLPKVVRLGGVRIPDGTERDLFEMPRYEVGTRDRTVSSLLRPEWGDSAEIARNKEASSAFLDAVAVCGHKIDEEFGSRDLDDRDQGWDFDDFVDCAEEQLTGRDEQNEKFLGALWTLRVAALTMHEEQGTSLPHVDLHGGNLALDGLYRLVLLDPVYYS